MRKVLIFFLLIGLILFSQSQKAYGVVGVIPGETIAKYCNQSQLGSGTYNPNTSELVTRVYIQDEVKQAIANGTFDPEPFKIEKVGAKPKTFFSTNPSLAGNFLTAKYTIPVPEFKSTFAQNAIPKNGVIENQLNVRAQYESSNGVPRTVSCSQTITQNLALALTAPLPEIPAGPPKDGECQPIDTAVGMIPVCDLNEFAKWFLGWAIGIGGGIAFLLILWSGFQIMTSAGNPERLKAGREQLTAAISGLLFLIFSVFLLRLIGVEILHIPGF